MSKSALFIGDTQFPWVNPRSLNAVYEIAAAKQPNFVIQIGDLYDFLSFSPFPYKRSFITPDREISWGSACAVRMWDMLRYLCPKAEMFQLIGNHDERPIKRIRKLAPEFEIFVENGIGKLFNFPGVFTLSEQRQELEIELNDTKILCFHGYKLNPGEHLRELNRNIVFGHTHYGWTYNINIQSGTISELNCGYIANKHAFPMSFTKLRSTQRWTQGCGWWDDHGPRFIPFGWD